MVRQAIVAIAIFASTLPRPAEAQTQSPAAPSDTQAAPSTQAPAPPAESKPNAVAPQTGPAAQPPAMIELPPVTIVTPKEAPTPSRPKPRVARGARASAPSANVQPEKQPVETNPAAEGANGPVSALAQSFQALDAARENLSPTAGAIASTLTHEQIRALPQGENTPLDKVLLQTPGVTQDSAASGSIHVRNEHANVQYRLNGIFLPDGVSGFGQVLETSIVGQISLITGALPAQYGLRTSGIVDIQTRDGAFVNGGQVGVYGGSHGTFTTNLDYGGTTGTTEYFFTGRFFESDLGLENPTPSVNAIHDQTEQEKFFSYVSTILPNSARWSVISGAAVNHYQIPNNPGQPTIADLPAPFSDETFSSAKLNETQFEQNYYGVLAFQQTVDKTDYQISYFSRYSSVHFNPDPVGDLVFNGVSTDVIRQSFLNGLQGDSAWRVDPAHTIRAGFIVSAEQSYVATDAITFLTDTAGTPLNPAQLLFPTDSNSKLGTIAGLYLQDEWKLTSTLTLNLGGRFDQMWQYVDANQLSPRVSLVYKPLEGTVFHAGYARYFTPPSQVIAAPAAYWKFFGTTNAPDPIFDPSQTNPPAKVGPVLPERSHYFDAGVTQTVMPGLELGVDAYYKLATDLLDDGQFGAAYVLNGFNYAHGENEGVEIKATYSRGGFRAYGNIAIARQVATDIVSNQYLFSADELAYIATHDIYTDHAQTITASSGASYKWDGTQASLDMIYGSGLRDGFANTGHLPGYTQVNLGLSHEFTAAGWKPFTVRLAAVNLFDEVYEIRNGTGIGVFAPQYGPRRGFFVGLSQKF